MLCIPYCVSRTHLVLCSCFIVKSQQTFATPFQRTYSNRSRKQNYRVPVQSHSDDQRRSDTVPGNEHPLVASPGEPAAGLLFCHTRIRVHTCMHTHVRERIHTTLYTCSIP